MKGALQTSAILLPLALSLPAEAYPKKHGSSTKGGNNVQTSYSFSKDKFGDGATLNIPTQNGVQGGQTITTRDIQDFELYVREAVAEPKKKKPETSGGNQVETVYKFDKDTFGNNAVLNLGVQNGVKGGQTQGKGRRALEDFGLYVREALAEAKKKKQEAQTTGGNQVETVYKFDKDKFGENAVLNLGVQYEICLDGMEAADLDRRNGVQGGQTQGKPRRSLDDFELYTREEMLYGRDAEAEPLPFLNGGSAKGGDSKTNGGNKVENKNNLKKGNFGAGSTINMGNQNQQKGGNTVGGNGGQNRGNGGAGGQFSMPIEMPPMPMRRWILEERDAEEPHRSHGTNRVNSFTSFGPNGMSMFTQTHQRGGNKHGKDGAANTQNGADAPSIALVRRWLEAREAFLNGGGAKGGDSKTNGGNEIKNNNNVKGGKFGPGTTINMQNQNQQKGGNTVGGNGGVNYGKGGGGGSFSMPVTLPPMPMRRDIESLWAREALLDGGGAKGGDSKTKGGNHVKNNQNIKNVKAGPGTTINAGNQNQQSGGNTRGGNGGANFGNGGQGGSFSIPMQMPPMPMRRDLDFELELLEAREAEAEAEPEAEADLDVYYDIFAREAYADPEADAEPEDLELDARDAFELELEFDY